MSVYAKAELLKDMPNKDALVDLLSGLYRGDLARKQLDPKIRYSNGCRNRTRRIAWPGPHKAWIVLMTPQKAMDFVKKYGVVLESAHGPIPNLAEAIVGEKIRGSWWGHERRKEVFLLTRQVREAPDVLVCRLVDGKITYVHRRLWPALLRLASEFGSHRTNAIHEVHTPTGQHKIKQVPIRNWMPNEVREAAKALSGEDAIASLPKGVSF